MSIDSNIYRKDRINMNLEEQFERNNLINNISLYELYYQVAMGNIISESQIEDNMSYNIDFEQALGSLYELILDIQAFDYAEEIFERELQKQAAMDALQNFSNEHLEAVKNKELDVETFVNQINDNQFFNPAMIEICNKQMNNEITVWKDVITDDLSSQLIESIHALQSQ